jgi:hypothetical protein
LLKKQYRFHSISFPKAEQGAECSPGDLTVPVKAADAIPVTPVDLVIYACSFSSLETG